LSKFIAAFALVILFFPSFAQTEHHFFVQFHDKLLNYVELDDVQSFMSEKSLKRREIQGVKLDSIDLPVTKAYLDNTIEPGIELRFVSKWLNGAVISVQDKENAYKLKVKFFVDEVVYLGHSEKEKASKSGTKSAGDIPIDQNNQYKRSTDESKEYYNTSYDQIQMLRGIELHKAGLKGRGMLVAVFDAGFYRVDELSAFKSLRDENRLVATFDIVTGDQNVYEDNDHGMNVLGVMAANSPGQIMGTAPEASYVLFRTESKRFENLLEELNWVRAAEMADSMGVDVINSSLGYNTFDEKRLDHNHSELDGKTSYISRGAHIASTRGILVVNASGNDGNKSWHKINFPADASGILTVGAVDLNLNPPAFSSYGPTADYRIKPEISALGYQASITTTYGTGMANGTSFSCPIVAGMMTCLWQSDRSKSPEELISAISRSGHLFYNPDNVLGYGVPDFYKALTILGQNKSFDYNKTAPLYPIKDTLIVGDRIDIHIASDSSVRYELTRNKRFIFFKYRSKLVAKNFVVPADGFVSCPLNQKFKGKSKRVEISLYRLEKGGKKKGHLLFSESRILTNP